MLSAAPPRVAILGLLSIVERNPQTDREQVVAMLAAVVEVIGHPSHEVQSQLARGAILELVREFRRRNGTGIERKAVVFEPQHETVLILIQFEDDAMLAPL